MAPTTALLFSRRPENCTFTEDGYIDESSCDIPFWSSRTGAIVKWSLFLGLIVIIGLYLLIGYVHAQRRLQKGLPPLSYHRFLISRSALARVDPQYRPPQSANIYPYHPDGQYYDMHAVPPPVYDPNAPRPPMYEPLVGATKFNSNQQQPSSGPSQQQNEEGVEYGPPPGSPPPSSSRLQDTYAPPPGPPPSATRLQDTYAPPPGPPPSAIRPQGTGNTNPFRD